MQIYELCSYIFATPFMTCARIFKLLRAPGIDSTESIPYNLSSLLSVVMEQETPQQCPQNVIYIRVGMAQFTVWPLVNICYIDSILGSFSVPGIESPPLNPSKKLVSDKYLWRCTAW
jgi:hypothetical protein